MDTKKAQCFNKVKVLVPMLVDMNEKLSKALQESERQTAACEAKCTAQGEVLRSIGIEVYDDSDEEEEIVRKGLEAREKVRNIQGGTVCVPAPVANGTVIPDNALTLLCSIPEAIQGPSASIVNVTWGAARVAMNHYPLTPSTEPLYQAFQRKISSILTEEKDMLEDGRADSAGLKRALETILETSRKRSRTA